MNAATDTTTEPTATVRVSAHADCTHPRSKVARAACRRARRSGWLAIVRGDELAVKGVNVRVHTVDDMLEGKLLGWGEKRMIVRDADDVRVTIKTADVLKVEVAKPAADDTDA